MTPEALTETVREALGATTEIEWPCDPDYFTKAIAALDSLAARLRAAETALQQIAKTLSLGEHSARAMREVARAYLEGQPE